MFLSFAEDFIDQQEQALIPYAESDQDSYDSDEVTDVDSSDGVEAEGEAARADLGGGWGRIIFSPIRRGKHVILNVCRSTNSDASEGVYEQIITTKGKNPTLHHQARKSLWGDLWPF